MSNKILGHRAYGSIPHLPDSRLGEGDHKCSDGQAKICLEKERDKHDIIVVQEKVDGSCMSIARKDDTLYPLTRSGYHANTSQYEQHHYFSKWVLSKLNYNRFLLLLKNGERLVGEWLAQAHGTKYDLPHEPFVAFDLMVKHERLCYTQFIDRVGRYNIITPKLISYGKPIAIKDVLKRIEKSGHGAIDKVEGAVWRVERNNKVDFLTKYVRHDKIDGKYFPQNNDGEILWNWQPITDEPGVMDDSKDREE